MLKDCLEIFRKQYDVYGDHYILDSYTLGEGTYILVGQDMQVKRILDIIKTKEEVDRTQEGYEEFCYMDYYSKLIDMNKPIDPKKVIHSNNFMSFFLKKENLENGKLNNEVIDKYYEILADPLKKYKDKKKSIEIYEMTRKLVGEINQEQLLKNQEWIKKNIYQLLETKGIKIDKRYIKIFFETDAKKQFELEGLRYTLPNIYNDTQYNTLINENIYGMPNDNIGLNAKKPYLRHKTRKSEIPYLIDNEEVILQKKFFDYLMNQVSVGKVNIYFNQDGIRALPIKEMLDFEKSNEKEFSGYYLRVNKGKEVEIIDSDNILKYKTRIKGLNIQSSISINYIDREPGIVYGNIEQLEILSAMISNRFFNNYLANSYFGELSDKLKDEVVKRSILRSREAFFAWFYKGNKVAIRHLFPQVTMQIMKHTICIAEGKTQQIRAKEQWMLRDAVIKYLNKGEMSMVDQMQPILRGLQEKVVGHQEVTILEDKEYYMATGQLAYYLLSYNKSGKKTQALINPILNAKSDIQIKEQLKRLFLKYNYEIEVKNTRFKRLYAMILGYVPTGSVDEEALLYGYLQENVMYKKGEKINE